MIDRRGYFRIQIFKKEFLRDADSQRLEIFPQRRHIVLDRSIHAGFVLRIVTGDGREDHRHVCHRAPDRPHVVERD